MNYPKQRYTGEHPWMDREWLYDQYVAQDKSTQEIADKYGCKRNTIQCWLAKHKIKKEIVNPMKRNSKPYWSKTFLEEEYINKGKSIHEIADECGVKGKTISYWMSKEGISKRRESKTKFDDETVIEIIRLYCDEKMSANQIAKLYNTTHRTVLNLLKRNGVHIRNLSEAQFNYQDKIIPDLFFDGEQLRDLHWNNDVSCKELGETMGIAPGTVRRQMHRLGVNTKNGSEAKVGLMTGPNHPNWQGGKTSLYVLAREYCQVNLVPKVLARDNHTCQYCGTTNATLNVHHVVPFKKIIDSIIEEHPELNAENIEDKQKLYGAIVSDERFLDMGNLITLCKDCHLYKAHNYKKTISSQASQEEGSETISKESTS